MNTPASPPASTGIKLQRKSRPRGHGDEVALVPRTR